MAEPQRKRQRLELTATLVIDTTNYQKEFNIHRNLIAASSSKFLKQEMVSNHNNEKRTVLAATKSETLEGYINWLYMKDLLPKDAEEFDYVELMELYLLGEKLQDLQFCLAVVKEIVAYSYRSCTIPGHIMVTWAWRNIIEGHPLRDVLKELWLAHQVIDAIGMLRAHNHNQRYPREFILDLFEEVVERQNLQDTISSGTTRAKIEGVCMSFVEDSSLGQDEDDE